MQQRVEYLFNRYYNNEATRQEIAELVSLLEENNIETAVSPAIRQLWDDQQPNELLSAEQKNRIIHSIINAAPKTGEIIKEEITGEENEADAVPPAHRIPSLAEGRHFLKTAWFRYAAAVLIIFGIGAYLWNNYKHAPASTAGASAKAVKNDIAPGSNRAVLTLSDGRKVELTPETKNIEETGTAIENNNGRVTYSQGERMVMNTMSTPRGGQYQLTLSDGTRVWLNAASSITYPTSFTEKTREVSITGEAYFEVSTNKSKPFIVSVVSKPSPFEKGGSREINRDTDSRGIYQITVLGTSFNVNSYPDETPKTSLIDGSIKINNSILKPGQAYTNGKITTTNITQDLAWKNGEFNFQDLNLEQAMR
ncbi:MAG: FecR domain-containing protein, partial [Chitinophagaceae bacterium]|nr:FecR domain-containing protein [Chitinophagaceae bacterium]